VEDRDRTQGIYFVRYINDAPEAKGFFSKLFSWGSSDEEDKEAQRYRISVKAAKAIPAWSGIEQCRSAGNGPVGEKIITLLHEQLSN
jgi:outer membrane protein assembly factor BamC